ncbi:glycosyltransferase [Marmoricola sp. RAF53]|uniref:glycosyltransferase n=1 Tax=Marmoricola sp. RAF53 TaxID=3233059 RepID=UPI003F9A3970
MPLTVLVDPVMNGHHPQAVANLTLFLQGAGHDVLLLTQAGGTDCTEYAEYLGDVRIEVAEPFTSPIPPTAEIAAAVADVCRTRDVDTVVLMDADVALKSWWRHAPRAFRGIARKPRFVLMLTRYPARAGLKPISWKLKAPKAVLAAVARTRGVADRVAGFAGRDDMTTGWIVKRARDPEICSAHSRDRVALRAELGLPQDRKIVGVFGLISQRRNAHLIFEAIEQGAIDADLLLAGPVSPEVLEWVEELPADRRARVEVRDGFHPNDLLDKLVAAVDVAPIPLSNNGPSGIMGKATAAGVPVVTAGSTVRAKEIAATGGGVAVELTATGLADGIRAMLDRAPDAAPTRRVPPATAEEFASALLGIDADGRVFRGPVPRPVARSAAPSDRP